MAVSTIPKPEFPFYYFSPTTAGTSQVTIERAHGIVYGRFVYISARVKVLSALSTAMATPLIELSAYPPSSGGERYTPGMVTIHKSNSHITYADFVVLKPWPSGIFYALQNVTSDLSAGDFVDFAFCYIRE